MDGSRWRRTRRGRTTAFTLGRVCVLLYAALYLKQMATSSGPEGARRSVIWNFFDPRDGASKCLVCGSLLKTPTGTTTTLVNHLKRHPTQFKSLESLKAQAQLTTSEPAVKKRPAENDIASFSAFKPKLSPDSPRARRITGRIASFIVRGMHSYSIVDEPGFRSLLDLLAPEYNVPVRTTFSRSVIPKMYEEAKQRLQDELLAVLERSPCCYSITSDSWTSRAGDSYVSLTFHVLDDDFVPRSFVIACQEIKQEHSAENLRSLLETVAEEWHIPASLPGYVVTDNARNFVAAVSRTNWTHIACFAHTLQLCVHDAKTATQGFQSLCSKARSIVGHYKRSSHARAQLHEIQRSMGAKELEVIQDVPTRWNSEFLMLSRLLELRPVIAAHLAAIDAHFELSANEWRKVSAYVSVLKPLSEATTLACSAKYPTLSEVIPLLHCVQTFLVRVLDKSEADTIMFARNVVKSLKTRFPDYKMTPLCILATLLDPRFKDVCFETGSEKNYAKVLLCTEVEKESVETLRPQDTAVAQTSATPGGKSTVWEVFEELATRKGASSPGTDTTEEVADYLGSSLLPRVNNPLTWWREVGQKRYPRLCKAAQKYLSIPATQVASERLFSACSNTVTDRRTDLLPEHVEQLVFLNGNTL